MRQSSISVNTPTEPSRLVMTASRAPADHWHTRLTVHAPGQMTFYFLLRLLCRVFGFALGGDAAAPQD